MYHFAVDRYSNFGLPGKSSTSLQRDKNEFDVVENPYHGDGGDIEMNSTRTSPSKLVDLNDTQIVTATKNVHYEI